MSNTDTRQYTLGHSDHESQRLITQSHLYENITMRFFDTAGIRPGMKVLDIGSGTGDVAMAAASLVGEDGQVIGVDINPEVLKLAQSRTESVGFSNIEFRTGDVNAMELESDFDAIVGRLVLMYLADPADVLKQLSTYLKPGGIVAFQEVELTTYLGLKHPETPVTNSLVDWSIEVFTKTGANVSMGFDLYKTFMQAGLPVPTMHFEAPMGCSENWGGFAYVEASFRSLLPVLEKLQIATAAEVDIDTLGSRLMEETEKMQRALYLPPHVTAFVRLPG